MQNVSLRDSACLVEAARMNGIRQAHRSTFGGFSTLNLIGLRYRNASESLDGVACQSDHNRLPGSTSWDTAVGGAGSYKPHRVPRLVPIYLGVDTHPTQVYCAVTQPNCATPAK